MGWEVRKGRRYYYRKVRGEDGRVRLIYCGTGERGEAAAREDAKRRAVSSTRQEILTPVPIIESLYIEKQLAPPTLEPPAFRPIPPPPSVPLYPIISPPRSSGRSISALRKWRELKLRRR